MGEQGVGGNDSSGTTGTCCRRQWAGVSQSHRSTYVTAPWTHGPITRAKTAFANAPLPRSRSGTPTAAHWQHSPDSRRPKRTVSSWLVAHSFREAWMI